MKTKLLILFLLLSVHSFAQVPANGLVGEYSFNGGSLVDGANGNSFTQTGTAMTTVDDRFLTTNNALNFEGDYFTRTNINYPASGNDIELGSISFWIKTTTNDTNIRTILDDTNGRSDATTDNTWAGYYFYLRDGKVGISGRVEYDEAAVYYRGVGVLSTDEVSDGNWHHVVGTIRNNLQFTGASDIGTAEVKLYVDGVSQGTSSVTELNNIGAGGLHFNQTLDTSGNITLGNNRTNSFPAANTYQDEFDDLLFYNRHLSAAEINQIGTTGGFCFAPEASNITISNILETSADVSIPSTTTYDLAYHDATMPFSSATIIPNISSGTAQLIGLTSSTEYMVYIREHCNSTILSSWSSATSFRTKGPIFVDKDAVGSNDGSSWANAYTNLTDALLVAVNDDEIWIADGTYTPHATDKTVSYTVTSSNVKIYGGFSGVETMRSERDWLVNKTILSGDLNSDDNGTIEFNEATRADNTDHIFQLNASNTSFDGLTISGGHAIGATVEHSAAVYVPSDSSNGFTMRNCTVENNVADYGAFTNLIIQNTATHLAKTILVENSIIQHNLGRHSTIYARNYRANRDINITIVNSIFNGNTVKDRTAGDGYIGSVVWARSLGSSGGTNETDVFLTMINCTLVKNKDEGTHSTLNNFNRAPVVVGQNATGQIMNTEISNTLFWNNTAAGGAISKSVTSVYATEGFGAIKVYNSVANDDFSELAAADKINTSSTDPLFTDFSNDDFTLQPTSLAIDTADSSKYTSSTNTDLANNPRFFGNNLDKGAYEQSCSGTCYTLTINTVGFGNVENNGIQVNTVSVFDAGTVVSLEPVADVGYGFYEWSGDATGDANPLSLTMNSDITITATFFEVPLYVDVDATGNNDGTSWANAYTNLQDALTNATPGINIWVASGTYKPGSARADSFDVAINELHIYGGFNGTESSISERDILANPTILSGDLNGNDAGHGTGTRGDNSYNVMKILNADDVVVDGFKIKYGHANGTSINAYGGAIYIGAQTSNLIIKNCDFDENFGLTGGAIRSYLNNNTSMTFENCTFYNNLSRYGAGLYFLVDDNATVSLDITNCLFNRNRSEDIGSDVGYTGSSAWIRANGTGSNLTTTITNCTFGGNNDVGSHASSVKGTLGLSRRTDGNSTHNATINNSIFYFNDVSGGSTGVSVNQGHVSMPNTVAVNNSISEDSFSNLSLLTNTSSSNPQFTDAPNFDFTLQASSPAIDAGDNSLVPSGITTDLLFNQRIHNATVDMGAYEFGASSTLSVEDFGFAKDLIKVYPNPTNGILNIKTTLAIKSIEVYNVLGTKVKTTKLPSINLSGLSNGFYLVKVNTETGSVTKRIIKR